MVTFQERIIKMTNCEENGSNLRQTEMSTDANSNTNSNREFNDANDGNLNEDSNNMNNEDKGNNNHNNNKKVPSPDDLSNAADDYGDENDKVDNNEEDDHEDLKDTHAANIRENDQRHNINYTSLGGTKIALSTTNLLLSCDNNLLMERLAISLCTNIASIHTTSRIPPEPPPL